MKSPFKLFALKVVLMVTLSMYYTLCVLYFHQFYLRYFYYFSQILWIDLFYYLYNIISLIFFVCACLLKKSSLRMGIQFSPAAILYSAFYW